MATIPYNIKTDFGATGSSSDDCASAFQAFRTAALLQSSSDTIELTIPAGNYYFKTGNFAENSWTFGIKNLRVIGAGSATTILKQSGVNGAYRLGGGGGVVQDNTHHAFMQTVGAGSYSVTLVTSSDASRLAVGRWVQLAGYNLQANLNNGFGFPPNHHFIEYKQIASIVGDVITFTEPLTYGYSSTWPNFYAGDADDEPEGGPGLIYAIDQGWDCTHYYYGFTMDQTDASILGQSIGRDITIENCEVVGVLGWAPSQNGTIRFLNVEQPDADIEVDKTVFNMFVTGGTQNKWHFQSSCIKNASFTDCTITTSIFGTPSNLYLSGCTIGELSLGTQAYGHTDYVEATNCIISAVSTAGSAQGGAAFEWVGAGTLRVSKGESAGAVAWAVPGTWFTWSGGNSDSAVGWYRVIDVTDVGGYAVVQTTYLGTDYPTWTSPVTIRVHPAPRINFTNCTGCASALSLSQAPRNAPYGSYLNITLDGSVVGAATQTFDIWGVAQYIKVNVTGTQSGKTYEFVECNIDPDVGTESFKVGDFNCGISGLRTITSSGVTGAQSGDSVTAVDANTWFSQRMNLGFTATNTAVVNFEMATTQGVYAGGVAPLRLLLRA